MATSGTFTSSRYGDQYGPWLELEWTRIDVDEANNRSKLEIVLRLHSSSGLYFSANKGAYLEGTSFTYSNGFSGTGSRTLKTLEKWFTHDSDGSYSVVLNGFLDIDVSWSGNFISRMSVSGTANITTIPRASDFNSFTLSDTSIKQSTSTTINYNLTRKSTAFSHDMELKYGSKVIASWTTSGTGALTRTLSATEANEILQAMSSVTSGTLKLYMQTKSGSTRVGSEVSKSEGITVNSAIKPTASSLSFSIAGTGRDKTINKYIQGITKVTASFSSTAGYGATRTLTKITVKRSDGANAQTISGSSGTTDSPVAYSGSYTVEAYVKDSRGRTDTVTSTFTVDAYKAPNVSKFTAGRQIAATANVDLAMIGTWSPLGTLNPATVLVQGKDNLGVVTTLYTLSSSTAGSVNRTQVATTQDDSKSYTYTITITDSFGNVTKASSSVGTSFVELSISRGKGIGVGKVHQKGALDVSGDIYLSGTVTVSNGYLNLNNNALIANIYGTIADANIDYIWHDDSSNSWHFVSDSDVITKQQGNSRIVAGSLLVLNADDAGPTGGVPPLQIGATDSYNLRFDNNEIMATHNGSVWSLHLNNDGGPVYVGNNTGTNIKFENGEVSADKITTPRINADMLYALAGSSGVYLNSTALQMTNPPNYDEIWFNDSTNEYYFMADASASKSVASAGAGTLRAKAFTVLSERESKTEITPLDVSALEMVASATVYNYRYKHDMETENNGRMSPSKRIGLMADELPEDATSIQNNGVDLYAMSAILWKSVQELSSYVLELEQKIKRR